MTSKNKKDQRKVYDLDTDQIRTRLNDLGERCMHLAKELDDHGAQRLSESDRNLIRFAYVGILKTHFSEATFCVMSGDLANALESLTHAQALIEQLP